MLKNIISRYENKNIVFSPDNNDKVIFNGRIISIKRCITNLLNNATSYGKKIEVILKKTKYSIIIFIDDDGPGIPESERENVIKPFYRMDESRSQNKSGVGLGLSIASDIIRSHGGDLVLDNEQTISGVNFNVNNTTITGTSSNFALDFISS